VTITDVSIPEGFEGRGGLGSDLSCFWVDADRNVVAVTPAMERLTGFEARDVIGRSCLLLHRCPECLKGCGVFQQGIVENKELDLFRADGSPVRVRKSGVVFRGEDGRPRSAFEIVEPLEADEAGWSAAERDEAARIRRALEETRYHRAEAAGKLDMSRTTLWRKMKRYGL